MRHRHGYRKLNKPTDQRLALLRSLVRSVFISTHIDTTLVRAKEVSRMVNKLISVAKRNDVAARREVFKLLPDRDLVKKVFEMVASLPLRSGSYLRTTVLGRRKGDASLIARLEIIDASSTSEGVIGK